MDLVETNKNLRKKSPLEIIEWATNLEKKVIATTNFGPNEAVLLHLINKVSPKMDIIWIDSGYNTKATYIFSQKIIEKFKLNIHIFNPLISAKRRDALMQGIPDIESDLHEEFTYQVKIEPFQRAIKKFKPQIWLTAIRKEQTFFRQNLNIVTMDGNLIKVAPVFYLTNQDMEDYLKKNRLPNEQDYYDPTKVLEHRECGLHKRSHIK